jgi:DNA-3-methyladenine glycosylase
MIPSLSWCHKQAILVSIPVLSESFYQRPVLQVARDLLGQRLVRQVDGLRISGLIVETEAYDGESDLACHARVGRTERTTVMYGPPGRAYVYFTYGMHWLLNCVTGDEGYPAAVLLRAIYPLEGQDWIARHRAGRKAQDWCNGPAKICQALAINGLQNGQTLCRPESGLWIETGQAIADHSVSRTPRIGINSVPEPWRSIPWRFLVHSPGQLFAKA